MNDAVLSKLVENQNKLDLLEKELATNKKMMFVVVALTIMIIYLNRGCP